MLITGQPIDIAIGPPSRLSVRSETAAEYANYREGNREVGEPAPTAVKLLFVTEASKAFLVYRQSTVAHRLLPMVRSVGKPPMRRRNSWV